MYFCTVLTCKSHAVTKWAPVAQIGDSDLTTPALQRP